MGDGLAIGYRYRTVSLARPRFAAFELGIEVIGVEDAVLDGHTVVADIARKAAIVAAVGSLETAVELTVADGESATHTAHKAAIGGVTIHAAVNRHRRTAVLDVDGAACLNR